MQPLEKVQNQVDLKLQLVKTTEKINPHKEKKRINKLEAIKV
jgi:hypothetical protein